MAFGNRVTSITQDFFAPKAVDTVLNSNPFAVRQLASAELFRGETMKFPVRVLNQDSGSSFSGFDTFSTTATDEFRDLAYTPKSYAISISLPLDEITANSGEEQVIDLVDLKMQAAAQSMADGIGTLFYGDGTGNSSKDFLGLGAIVDDGSSVATIGGLSRSTYSTLQSTVTASGGTLSLAKMSTMYNAVSSGSVVPTAIYTDEATWALYEQLLNPQLRINRDLGFRKEMRGGTGFTGLDYKGIAVIKDEKCTSGTMFFLNENFIKWAGKEFAMATAIKPSSDLILGNDYDNNMGKLGFSWTGWKKSVNQAAIVGQIIVFGELMTTNPKRHGKLTGITSV